MRLALPGRRTRRSRAREALARMPLNTVQMAATVDLFCFEHSGVFVLVLWPFHGPDSVTLAAMAGLAGWFSVVHAGWIALLALSIVERSLDRSRLRWRGHVLDGFLLLSMVFALLASLAMARALPGPGELGYPEGIFEFENPTGGPEWSLVRP